MRREHPAGLQGGQEEQDYTRYHTPETEASLPPSLGTLLIFFFLIVSYMNYGPFTSYAPTYDSSFANVSKDDSDLIYSFYGEESSLQGSDRCVSTEQVTLLQFIKAPLQKSCLLLNKGFFSWQYLMIVNTTYLENTLDDITGFRWRNLLLFCVTCFSPSFVFINKRRAVNSCGKSCVSLSEFLAKSDEYVYKLADNLLDAMTNGEHSKTLAEPEPVSAVWNDPTWISFITLCKNAG